MKWVLAVLVSMSVIACPRPEVFRCDPVTGADCDAGLPDANLLGEWTMKVWLAPDPDGGPSRAVPTGVVTVDHVMFEKAQGGWKLNIPGRGGFCCSPPPFIAEGASFTLPPQSINVFAETPMKLEGTGMGPLYYLSLTNWFITLKGTTAARFDGASMNFSQGQGETLDSVTPLPDGGFDAIKYLHTIEFSR